MLNRLILEGFSTAVAELSKSKIKPSFVERQFLYILGWGTEDIICNKKRELEVLSIDGSPACVILQSLPSGYRKQSYGRPLLRLMSEYKCNTGIITNGVEWLIYPEVSSKLTSNREKYAYKFDLRHLNEQDYEYLEYLTKTSFNPHKLRTLHPDSAVEQVFVEFIHDLVNEPDDKHVTLMRNFLRAKGLDGKNLYKRSILSALEEARGKAGLVHWTMDRKMHASPSAKLKLRKELEG